MDTSEISGRYHLEDCIQCKKCTKNCASAEHGGIVPSDIVRDVREGSYSGDPWLCLMCHRCSAVCPKDIDVAELILELRNIEVKKGNVPERFDRVYKKYLETGDTMSIIGPTNEARKELGLPEFERDPEIKKKIDEMSGGRR